MWTTGVQGFDTLPYLINGNKGFTVDLAVSSAVIIKTYVIWSFNIRVFSFNRQRTKIKGFTKLEVPTRCMKGRACTRSMGQCSIICSNMVMLTRIVALNRLNLLKHWWSERPFRSRPLHSSMLQKSITFNLSNLSVLAVFDWLLQLDYLVPGTKHRLPWAARLAWHLTATMPCGRQRGRLGSCAVCVRKINVSLPMSMYIDIFICKKDKS